MSLERQLIQTVEPHLANVLNSDQLEDDYVNSHHAPPKAPISLSLRHVFPAGADQRPPSLGADRFPAAVGGPPRGAVPV